MVPLASSSAKSLTISTTFTPTSTLVSLYAIDISLLLLESLDPDFDLLKLSVGIVIYLS